MRMLQQFRSILAFIYTTLPAMGISVGIAGVFSTILQMAMLTPANATEPDVIPLTAKNPPLNVWKKLRLVSELNDEVIRISDNEQGEFNDASLWEIEFNEAIPYGRKKLTFQLLLGALYKPLWGNMVLSPLANGKPISPSIDVDGKLAFEPISGDDGRAYVPVGVKSVSLKLNKEVTSLNKLSFYLAGASKTDIRLKNFEITVWPEANPEAGRGAKNMAPVIGSLPFRPKDQKIILLETARSKIKYSSKIILNKQGAGDSSIVELPMKLVNSNASGTNVSAFDFSQSEKPGRYKITLPPVGQQAKAHAVPFEIDLDQKKMLQARDDAWGVFYWITDNQNGPYGSAHKQDSQARIFETKSKTRNVRGGWFDAGDYGKYVTNGAFSTALMLLTGLHAPEALDHQISPLANRTSSQPDWLSVAETELAWLLTMQNEEGGVNHKATSRSFPAMEVTPQADLEQKWVMPVTSTATADFAATMSLAALIYQNMAHDDGNIRAALFEEAAARALNWLDNNPKLKMIETTYSGHDYGGAYLDDQDDDERFFASAAHAALTRNSMAIKNAVNKLKDRAKDISDDGPELSWRSVDLLGMWALLLIEKELDEPSRVIIKKALGNAAKTWRKIKSDAPWRISIDDNAPLPWGSNGMLATTGWHWLLWSWVSGDKSFDADARDQLNWFYGRNPLGKIFVTGKGADNVKFPHFRPWVSGAIKLPSGFLVGGPNSGVETRKDFAGIAPMRRYKDETSSYATNEVAINWQSAWALYLSLLCAEK